jgi:hypothetical protein
LSTFLSLLEARPRVGTKAEPFTPYPALAGVPPAVQRPGLPRGRACVARAAVESELKLKAYRGPGRLVAKAEPSLTRLSRGRSDTAHLGNDLQGSLRRAEANPSTPAAATPRNDKRTDAAATSDEHVRRDARWMSGYGALSLGLAVLKEKPGRICCPATLTAGSRRATSRPNVRKVHYRCFYHYGSCP